MVGTVYVFTRNNLWTIGRALRRPYKRQVTFICLFHVHGRDTRTWGYRVNADTDWRVVTATERRLRRTNGSGRDVFRLFANNSRWSRIVTKGDRTKNVYSLYWHRANVTRRTCIVSVKNNRGWVYPSDDVCARRRDHSATGSRRSVMDFVIRTAHSQTVTVRNPTRLIIEFRVRWPKR